MATNHHLIRSIANVVRQSVHLRSAQWSDDAMRRQIDLLFQYQFIVPLFVCVCERVRDQMNQLEFTNSSVVGQWTFHSVECFLSLRISISFATISHAIAIHHITTLTPTADSPTVIQYYNSMAEIFWSPNSAAQHISIQTELLFNRI